MRLESGKTLKEKAGSAYELEAIRSNEGVAGRTSRLRKNAYERLNNLECEGEIEAASRKGVNARLRWVERLGVCNRKLLRRLNAGEWPTEECTYGVVNPKFEGKGRLILKPNVAMQKWKVRGELG